MCVVVAIVVPLPRTLSMQQNTYTADKTLCTCHATVTPFSNKKYKINISFWGVGYFTFLTLSSINAWFTFQWHTPRQGQYTQLAR